MRTRLLDKPGLLISAIALASCGPQRIVVDPPSEAPAPVAIGGQTVVVLPAQVRFERLDDESPLPGDEHDGAAIAASMSVAARRLLAERELRPFGLEDLSLDRSRAGRLAAQRLAGSYFALTAYRYRHPDQSLSAALHALRAATEAELACVQLLHVKIGTTTILPLGSGMPSPNPSSSLLRVALVSLDDGERPWRAEVFQRELPTVTNIEGSVELAFGRLIASPAE